MKIQSGNKTGVVRSERGCMYHVGKLGSCGYCYPNGILLAGTYECYFCRKQFTNGEDHSKHMLFESIKKLFNEN